MKEFTHLTIESKISLFSITYGSTDWEVAEET